MRAGSREASAGVDRRVVISAGVRMRCFAIAASFAVFTATANAVPVEVSQVFDFSSNPVTLTPFDPSVAQNLSSGQYITLNVILGQKLTSWGSLEISGVISGIPSPDYISGVRWGNYGLPRGWASILHN
jgi:hypothetical protein